MSVKNINLDTIKLSKKQQLTSLKPAFLLSLLVNGAQTQICSSTCRPGIGKSFQSSSVHHSGNHSTKRASKGTIGEGSRGWNCSLTAGSNGASSISSSHSSNIIILWWTAAVFQHCLHNILNKKIIRSFNFVLTVKDTNISTKEIKTLKKSS